MKKIYCSLCLFFAVVLEAEPEIGKIVTATKRIDLQEFPNAFNPSIIKIDQGILLAFRYSPDLEYEPWISYIGVVLLNENFEIVSKPQLLNSRIGNAKIPSQSEDARLFSYKDKLYLIFNDNSDVYCPTLWDRRDMFMAALSYNGQDFELSNPVKLIHTEKYPHRLWQKNWCPFVWQDTLLITYTINPHEVLYPSMKGSCYSCYETVVDTGWNFGELRGSGSAQLVDDEYLSFFHSGIYTSSKASYDLEMWHYYMGACTFSADPPFQMTKITPLPIIAKGFYTPSTYEKRVIMPGGFVVSDHCIYVAYGKDDCELWIATLDKEELKKAMVPVQPSH